MTLGVAQRTIAKIVGVVWRGDGLRERMARVGGGAIQLLLPHQYRRVHHHDILRLQAAPLASWDGGKGWREAQAARSGQDERGAGAP